MTVYWHVAVAVGTERMRVRQAGGPTPTSDLHDGLPLCLIVDGNRKPLRAAGGFNHRRAVSLPRAAPPSEATCLISTVISIIQRPREPDQDQ